MIGSRDLDLRTRLIDLRQFRATAEFAEARPYLLYRPPHSRFEIVWMQRIQNEQATDHVVPGKFVDDHGARFAAPEDDLHYPFQPRSVQVKQELDQFLGCIFLRSIRELIELRDQFAQLSNLVLKCAAVRHKSSPAYAIKCEPDQLAKVVLQPLRLMSNNNVKRANYSCCVPNIGE